MAFILTYKKMVYSSISVDQISLNSTSLYTSLLKVFNWQLQKHIQFHMYKSYSFLSPENSPLLMSTVFPLSCLINQKIRSHFGQFSIFLPYPIQSIIMLILLFTYLLSRSIYLQLHHHHQFTSELLETQPLVFLHPFSSHIICILQTATFELFYPL